MSEADDLRQFIRDLNTRAERRTDVMVRALETLAVEVRAQRQTMAETMADMLDELKAQRSALFLILDEIRGAQGGAGPGSA